MGMLEINEEVTILNIVTEAGKNLIDKWGDPNRWDLEDSRSAELQSDLENANQVIKNKISEEFGRLDSEIINKVELLLNKRIENSFKQRMAKSISADDNRLITCLEYVVRMSYVNKIINNHLAATAKLEAA